MSQELSKCYCIKVLSSNEPLYITNNKDKFTKKLTKAKRFDNAGEALNHITMYYDIQGRFKIFSVYMELNTFDEGIIV